MADTPVHSIRASWASSSAARATMQANRSRDTTPELAVRRRVHAVGMRYLVNARPEPDLRRTVDLLFRRPRVAVLVDGCFWHGCPEHHQAPKANAIFWSEKVRMNRARDAETNHLLTARGWLVLRFWEHEIRADPQLVATHIVEAVRARSADALAKQSVENRSKVAGEPLAPDREGTVEQQVR